MKNSLFILVLLLAAGAGSALTLDEKPAQPGEWGYRPADIQVDQNPPGFTWRPCRDAASFVLQVASDADFTQIVYEHAGLPWNAHCPPKALPTGRLYWRYAAADEKGERTAWSQTRTFEIPEDAVVFPQPGIDDLLKQLPEAHPRIFFRPEDIPHLQEQAQGALADRWKGIQGKADKLLATPPDTSEPPLYPKGTKHKGEEWKKIWWGNRVRMVAVVEGAATLAFAYRISGEEKYAEGARDLLLAMCQWDPEGSTRYRYNDEAAMPALYMASRAYSWAYPIFTEAERGTIAGIMRIRGGQAFKRLRGSQHLWRPYGSHNNRCWHFLGELAMAFHGEIPEAPQWLDYAMTIFYTCYPAWGGKDGGWHEGMAYFSSYTSRVMWWGAAIRSAFGIDLFERPFYHSVGYYPMYVLPPGSETGGFGDLALKRTSGQMASLEALLASGARNPYWQWYTKTSGGGIGGGYFGFVAASQAAGLESKPPTDLPSSRAFKGIGLAILNTDLMDGKQNIQVHFKSSPFGRQSHGYNANNAFLLNLHGQAALVRAGERDIHGSPHHYKYMHHSKSDNCILVNGEGQRFSAGATGRISVFETSPTVDVVVGEADEAYDNLTRFTRRIVFLKPHAIVIHDVLDAPEPSSYEWTLHGSEPFEIGENALVWNGKPGKLDIRFLTPQNLAITQTDTMDPPPYEWSRNKPPSWHIHTTPPEKAAHQEFLTVIAIEGAEVQTDHDPATGALKVTTPGGEANLSLTADAFGVQCGDIDWRWK